MKSRNALFSCSRSVDDELRSAKPSNLVCILRTYLLTRICEYTHTKKHTERPQHSTQHMHRHPHISKSLSAAMFMLCAHMCECHQVSCQPMRFNPALAGHGDADGLADLAACLQVDALLAANLWLFHALPMFGRDVVWWFLPLFVLDCLLAFVDTGLQHHQEIWHPCSEGPFASLLGFVLGRLFFLVFCR